MSVKPMNRESMRGLKAKTDEKNRLEQIDRIVSTIQQQAIQKAKVSTETSIQLEIRGICNPQFMIENKDGIVSSLSKLFPDCSVEYQTLTRGNDGKMYDFSKMDKTMLQFINNQKTRECLVIDWS